MKKLEAQSLFDANTSCHIDNESNEEDENEIVKQLNVIKSPDILLKRYKMYH